MEITISDLYIGGVKMPCPALQGVTVSYNKIWSKNTGRAAADALMHGTVVAMKRTFSISWNTLTMEQYKKLRDAIESEYSFRNMRLVDDTGEEITVSVYFGTLEATIYSYAPGKQYITGAKVEAVER